MQPSLAMIYKARKNSKVDNKIVIAVAGDRTRVTRVTGGNTYHYTTTTEAITYFRERFTNDYQMDKKLILFFSVLFNS